MWKAVNGTRTEAVSARDVAVRGSLSGFVRGTVSGARSFMGMRQVGRE